MAFSYLTFANAAQILIGRLQPDGSGFVYWSQDEILRALYEAVRWWNAATASYKVKVAFDTQANQPCYDLATVGSASTAPAFGYTVTDVDLATEILYALLETNPQGLVAGSGQFQLADVQTAIQGRLNRFIGDTGCVVTQQVVAGPSPPVDTTPLPDSVLDVRRAAWVPPSADPAVSTTGALWRDDELGIDSFLPSGVQNPAVPLVYTTFGNPPALIRVAPPPLDVGQLDLIMVLSGPQITLSLASPVTLGIPDDLAWVIKWGALADLLNSDGPARDPDRAAYCEQRYQEGVQMARMLPSALVSDVGNVTVDTGSVFDLDYYMPSWQIQRGQPSYVGMAGRNLVCLGPVPNGAYGVGMRVVANMPVSSSGFIQVSRDQIDPVLDMAQHIASFKMGGAEFMGTSGRYESAVKAASNQNGRLSAIAFYRPQLQLPAVESIQDEPRMKV